MKHMPAILFTWLLALPAWSDAVSPATVAAVSIRQASEIDGDAVPRTLLGVAGAGGDTLPFHVALEFSCPVGTEPGQLFVSIADTAQVQALAAAGPAQTWRLDVPLRQLQWFAEPTRYCATVSDQRPPDEVDGSGIRFFRLHAGTAAYATVTCRGPQGVLASATSSAPLDVWLSCPADPPPGGG